MARWSRSGFEVVVPFRRRHLRLASNIASLDEAIRVGRQLRATRRHRRDAVGILEVATGIFRPLTDLEAAEPDLPERPPPQPARQTASFVQHVAVIRMLCDTLERTRRLAAELNEVIVTRISAEQRAGDAPTGQGGGP